MPEYVRNARIKIWAKTGPDSQVLVPYSDADIVVFTQTNYPTTFSHVAYEWVEPGGAEGAHRVNNVRVTRSLTHDLGDEWLDQFVTQGYRIEVWSREHIGVLLDQHTGRVGVGQMRLPEE